MTTHYITYMHVSLLDETLDFSGLVVVMSGPLKSQTAQIYYTGQLFICRQDTVVSAL